MSQSKRVSGMVLNRETTFTLVEFCRACGTSEEVVVEMVAEGVIEAQGERRGDWRFHGETLVRAQRALRLVEDLHVNWPGAALALDLLEKLERR